MQIVQWQFLFTSEFQYDCVFTSTREAWWTLSVLVAIWVQLFDPNLPPLNMLPTAPWAGKGKQSQGFGGSGSNMFAFGRDCGGFVLSRMNPMCFSDFSGDSGVYGVVVYAMRFETPKVHQGDFFGMSTFQQLCNRWLSNYAFDYFDTRRGPTLYAFGCNTSLLACRW